MIDLAGWLSRLDELFAVIASRFGRTEPRSRATEYLRGLLSELERKNGWTLAERAGAVSPDGMQRLLRTARWDVDGVRDDVRGWVFDQLGDRVSGVLVVDLCRGRDYAEEPAGAARGAVGCWASAS